MDINEMEFLGFTKTKIDNESRRKVYVGFKDYEDIVFMQIAADFDLDMLDRYIEGGYIKEIDFKDIKIDDGLIFVDIIDYGGNGVIIRNIVRDDDGLYYFIALSEPYNNGYDEWSIDTL